VSAHPAPYLEALRLFNEGAYFESHEVLEDLWRVTSGEDRRFYQGLIQLAVVLHHLRRGNATGAANVLATCRRHLQPYRPRWRGLSVDELLALADRVDGALDAARREGRPPSLPDRIPTLAAE